MEEIKSLQFAAMEAHSAEALDSLPREITNAMTGDRLKLLHTPADGFDSVRIQFTLPPHAAGAPLHYHANFVESFEVIEGRLEMSVNSERERQTLAPGSRIDVPKGILHSFRNPHPVPVTFVTEVRPAVEFEKFVRAMYGLANDGKTNREGMPTNFLHLALTLDFADLYFPVAPASLQRIVRKTLAAFARIAGADKELAKYFAATA